MSLSENDLVAIGEGASRSPLLTKLKYYESKVSHFHSFSPEPDTFLLCGSLRL